jgi:ppGpp synthetase/RelA/SpoT-type nucleotidyltranferase
MKIPKRVAEIYDDLFPQFLALKKEVDGIIEPEIRNRDWFYRSRVKKLDSFYQKLEVDPRYRKNEYEDFLGCEIVVDSRDNFKDVLAFLERFFRVEYQRPELTNETTLDPENFRFADLRLYVKRKSALGLPQKEFLSKRFEIQLKTVFSYSWAKATHDLIYKGKRISWARERVAFQVKAMLEQSEYAISNIENTDDSFFPKHTRFSALQAIAEKLSEKWDESLLPTDLRRCATNILRLGQSFGLELNVIVESIAAGLTADFVSKHRNLTPFFAALVIFQPEVKSTVLAKSNQKERNRFLITDEIQEYLESDFFSSLVQNGYAYTL